jgi:hypothetical protein
LNLKWLLPTVNVMREAWQLRLFDTTVTKIGHKAYIVGGEHVREEYVALVDGKLFGSVPRQYQKRSANVYVVDLTTQQLSSMQPRNPHLDLFTNQLSGHATIAYDGRLFVFGGAVSFCIFCFLETFSKKNANQH